VKSKTNKNILVGGSWKMYKNLDQSIEYIKALNKFCLDNINEEDKIDVFFLPTFLPLYHLSGLVTSPRLKYGAQDCCWEDEGAFTGEVSPAQLKDAGCSYVMMGHAERRRIFGEDDEMLSRKVPAALRNGIKPILCIGEREKEDDIKKTYSFLTDQVLKALKDVHEKDLENVIIAYEPVWAIGAAESAPVSYTEDILGFLRKLFEKNYGREASEKQYIFYGGAVNPDTAPGILRLDKNDGIFIGRASLDLKYFTLLIEMGLEVSRSRS
jgi:triosephosphate isomerase